MACKDVIRQAKYAPEASAHPCFYDQTQTPMHPLAEAGFGYFLPLSPEAERLDYPQTHRGNRGFSHDTHDWMTYYTTRVAKNTDGYTPK